MTTYLFHEAVEFAPDPRYPNETRVDMLLVLCEDDGRSEQRHARFTDNAKDRWRNDVLPFAQKLGLEQQLLRTLFWVASPDRAYPTLIGYDHAPHSFSFDQPKGLHGGIIYQGPDCPADGSMPSLTVSLAPGTGWFSHT